MLTAIRNYGLFAVGMLVGCGAVVCCATVADNSVGVGVSPGSSTSPSSDGGTEAGSMPCPTPSLSDFEQTLDAATVPPVPYVSKTCTTPAVSSTVHDGLGLITISGPATCTLSDLYGLQGDEAFMTTENSLPIPTQPLTCNGSSCPLSQGTTVWTLGWSIELVSGGALFLQGSTGGGGAGDAGSECSAGALDTLQLAAADPEAGVLNPVNIEANYGYIDIQSMHVTSSASDEQGPRPFILARSGSSDGGLEESRMDVRDSEIDHLGWNADDQYGLVWKLAEEVPFDNARVYGDVTGSCLHNNYYGLYSFGAEHMRIIDNQIYSNLGYGLSSHTQSDHMWIASNVIHDNGDDGISLVDQCNFGVVENNTLQNNQGNGLFLHEEDFFETVAGNQASHNMTAGFNLFDSTGNVVCGNQGTSNQDGIDVTEGSSDNAIFGNVLSMNSRSGIYVYSGTEMSNSGITRPSGNQIAGNDINGNTTSVQIEGADNNVFQDNQLINSPAIALALDDGLDNVFAGNTVPAGVSSLFTTVGAGSVGSVTTISGFPANESITVNVDMTSTVLVNDASGRVYSTTPSLPTSVSDAGSSITVTYAATNASGSCEIDSLPLRVSAPSATVTNVNYSTGVSKWYVTAPADTLMHFTLEGLTPTTVYHATVNETTITDTPAGANGLLEFGCLAPAGAMPFVVRVAPEP